MTSTSETILKCLAERMDMEMSRDQAIAKVRGVLTKSVARSPGESDDEYLGRLDKRFRMLVLDAIQEASSREEALALLDARLSGIGIPGRVAAIAADL